MKAAVYSSVLVDMAPRRQIRLPYGIKIIHVLWRPYGCATRCHDDLLVFDLRLNTRENRFCQDWGRFSWMPVSGAARSRQWRPHWREVQLLRTCRRQLTYTQPQGCKKP